MATYMGHPMAAAAGLAVQKEVLRRALTTCWPMSSPWASTCGAGLEMQRFANHHHVGDNRRPSAGLFRALELVADLSTNTPFDSPN